MEHPAKRVRVSSESEDQNGGASAPLSSLHRIITPPPRARPQGPRVSDRSSYEELAGAHHSVSQVESSSHELARPSDAQVISSPIQLTHIRDFPESKGYNVDTVKLRDLLGDPMIRECWQFNYLFDVDFLMSQFDEDVRSLVKVKVVHGSWERESANRVRVETSGPRSLTSLRVIIHTANMIHGDWANMTQAIWRSPLLPLQAPGKSTAASQQATFATGARFKRDLLSYLRAYGSKKTGSLVRELNRFDFDAVRAVLVASTPSKQEISKLDSDNATLWGWPALKDVLSRIPIHDKTTETIRRSVVSPHIIIQISSIASLGQTDKWLMETFFKALAPTRPVSQSKFSIIFPTPDEIRRSLEGYASGGSIHMKTQSAPQRKQLEYMRPFFCHWAGDGSSSSTCIDLSGDDLSPPPRTRREAGRARAAPHIKTYIQFTDGETMDSIDWAMVTSANLSTQAWGAAVNPSGEVRISSWEIGVLMWPELFVDEKVNASTMTESRSAVMVPCFQKDRPEFTQLETGGSRTTVGFRMPYDLPLTPYGASDEPWCATASHTTPDWRGQTWID
ncbi:hypothetical protein PDE_03078 [Penicillium oxalicum 114-2]|uniref:Tyrosyl-DNA phosphodiesterase n=1 Tax=Penicillium oxalicum (strain 114-2 / CGMCC 5302) TaxID=933388 RepID=S8B1B3_PENO1|nr:hypothetical protein PDE_03078 [Penicillium oxalicum 114-2]